MSEKIEFKLRKATQTDIQNFFDLSKEENVRENSIITESIKWEDHVKWFNEKLNSEEYMILVAVGSDDQFIGQVRYEFEKKRANISISISQDFRGLDLAAPIISESARFLFNYNNEIESIIAYIKEINIPSLKAFEQAGYIYYQQEIINDAKFLVYRFLRN